jgi:hypothetical protein
VELASAESPLFDVETVDRVEMYPLESDGPFVPVIIRFLHDDFLPFTPRREVERTIALCPDAAREATAG